MSTLGFIGLGVMGGPMALHLIRAGHHLVGWNRTAEKCAGLRAAGADLAPTAADVFARVGPGGTVMLMLFDEASTDLVLERRSASRFASIVSGRTLINMASVAPSYSRQLGADVIAAGGRFVEAPVSGSRIPAENAQLVAMMAGDESVCSEVTPVLQPMCRDVVYCGALGNGMLMKLAINIFMLTTSAGLAEAFHFAQRNGLPLDRFQSVANGSQMASQLSQVKLAKLMAGDFARQGAVSDGVNNTRLITDAAASARASAALITEVRSLYDEAYALGHGSDDMIAIVKAMQARSAALDCS